MLADRVANRRATREATRSDAVTMEEFGYLLAQGRGAATRTKAGVTMGPQRALGIPAWYSGTRYLTETVAALPADRYQTTPNGPKKIAKPAWMVAPDLELPWHSLVEFYVMSIVHRGNFYAYKVRDFDGVVTGLRIVHPDRVKPGQASDGTKVFQLDNRTDIAFTRREILHVPGMSYDGIVGLNPLQVHAETLGGVAAANESAQRFFGQGSIKEAFISAPATLTESQANEMRDVWEKQHQGLLNAHTVAVLGGGAEYKTIGLDPAAAQLLETRKWGVIEVAQILRIPPHKLYELTRATFSNIEHQSIEAATDSIQPLVERFEAHVNFDTDLTVPRTFMAFDLEGLLRGDITAQYEALSKAIGRPWMSAAEGRERVKLPYKDGLDTVATPLNMETGEQDGLSIQELALAVQKLYLGVGVMISDEEARQLIGLNGPMPQRQLPAPPGGQA